MEATKVMTFDNPLLAGTLHLHNSKCSMGIEVMTCERGRLVLELITSSDISTQNLSELLQGCFEDGSDVESTLKDLNYLSKSESLSGIVVHTGGKQFVLVSK